MRRGMKLLIATSQWFPDYRGGTARVVRTTAEGLARRGHEVLVVAPRAEGEPVETVENGVAVRRVVRRTPLPRTVTDIYELRRALVAARAEEFDVIVAHGDICTDAALSIRPRPPIALVFHASAARESRHRRSLGLPPLEMLRSLALQPLLHAFGRLALRRADRVLVLSEFSRNLVMETDADVGPRTRVVGGGVDTEVFSPGSARESLRAHVGLGPGEILLMTARRLVGRMGIELLIDGVRELNRRGFHGRLVIAGDGELRADLEARRDRVGLGRSIRFLGRISDRELRDWYRAADLFVLPTLAYEGFGMVTAEALACGTPVVGTDVGATAEILGQLDDRLLVRRLDARSLATAIERALDLEQPALRARSRNFALGRLSWDLVLEHWEGVLRELTDERMRESCNDRATRPSGRFPRRGVLFRTMSRSRRAAKRTHPLDVVMVLENNTYPRDSRVRKEAECLVGSGLSVEVLAPRGPDEMSRETIAGVHVRRFPLRDGRGSIRGTAVEYLVAMVVMGVAVLRRLARSRRGTLHIHNPPDFFFPLLWMARVRGWSTVFDHHDDAAGMLRAKLGRRTPVETILTWMRGRSACVADLTITSNETQRDLVRASARSTAVVRNAPPTWFADHRASRPNGCARVVFLGEIGTQDRVELAVDVLGVLLGVHRLDVELVVIGDGPQRSAVEARANALEIGDRVHVTGWIPYEQVPALLATAHVGIDTAPLTDVNHGSTMIKIPEYLAVGLPVVASALRETKVSAGPAVLTVDDDDPAVFADAIASLLSDADAWDVASSRAYRRSRVLQWPAQANMLVSAYESLTSRRCSDVEPRCVERGLVYRLPDSQARSDGRVP
jgi:glycosyltransferase involved in cell wall biosynthesis